MPRVSVVEERDGLIYLCVEGAKEEHRELLENLGFYHDLVEDVWLTASLWHSDARRIVQRLVRTGFECSGGYYYCGRLGFEPDFSSDLVWQAVRNAIRSLKRVGSSGERV